MSATRSAAPAWPSGRVGYVALLGRPNTGKSTFVNSVLEYHLAAVSPKPQTTRRRWLGIHTTDRAQILFLDAPGVHEPRNAMGEAMKTEAESALAQTDVILCLADSTRPPGVEDGLVAQRAAAARKPVFLAINKIDAATPEQVEALKAFYLGILGAVPVFTVAAVQRPTLGPLLAAVEAALPEGPFLYPPDVLTDVFERQIGAELIRETLLEHLREEIPHGMAVTIATWDEADEPCRIAATLHVERDNHRGIVIGKGGCMIAKLRRAAQAKLATLCDREVRLELTVKVADQWRRRPGGRMREFLLLG